MADKQQLARLKRNVNEWNAWRQGQPNLCPDLTEAHLAGLDLREADLCYANLENADLQGCNLTEADLSCANLRGVRLAGANLSFAACWSADLWDADLRGCNLTSANLEGVILKKTVLRGADISFARFCDMLMAQVDFRSVTGLATVIHGGPSTVDLTSVILPTEAETRLPFLRGVGFSDALISALPALLEAPSPQCFLSYASPDEGFVQRLSHDLQEHGVRCWLVPHGDEDNHISRGLWPREKLVLVLSEHAVKSSWVQFEVQVTLGGEQKQDAPVLFPLQLDAVVMQAEQAWAVRLRESRPVGDFTDWHNDGAYQEAFTALLQRLTGA